MRWIRLPWMIVFAAFVIFAGACQPVRPEPAGATIPTTAATGVATAESGAASAHASVSGFEVTLPDGWTTADDPGGLMIVASNPDLLKAEDLLPIQDGVLMLFLNKGKGELPPQPLPDLLKLFIDSRALPADVTAGPEETTIGDQPAVRVAGAGKAGEVPFIYLAAGIETETRVGRLIAVLPQAREAELRPLVEKVIDSVVVSEPAPPPIDLSKIEGEIASGEPITATLVPDTSMIWHFSGTAGQQLIVSATPTSTLDIVLMLVDAAKAPVLAGGIADSEGDGQSERRLATLPADGDYYVVVRGFTGSGGDFQVAITDTSVAGKIENAKDLVGTWGNHATMYRFDEDGSFRIATDEATLAAEPIYQGHYQVANGSITLGRNEAGDVCHDSDGTYEGVLLAGGELSLHPVEDNCPPRRNLLNDVVLPPVPQ